MSSDYIREIIGIGIQSEHSALERVNQLLDRSNTLWDAFAAQGTAALSTMERFSTSAASGMALLNAQVERFIGLMSGAAAATQAMRIPSYFGPNTSSIPIAQGAVPRLGSGATGYTEIPLGGNATVMIPSTRRRASILDMPRAQHDAESRAWGERLRSGPGQTVADLNSPEMVEVFRRAGYITGGEQPPNVPGGRRGVVQLDETGGRGGRGFRSADQAANSLGLTMLRHVLIYAALYEGIQLVTTGLRSLGENILAVDAAAARISYSSEISQQSGREGVLSAMITGARFGQGQTEAIGAFIGAGRFTKNQAEQQSLVEQSARMALLTGGDQADAMRDLITLTQQWNLQISQTPQVLDVMAFALKNTNVDLGQFIDAMSKGSVIGKAMGWNMQQTAGMYAGFMQISGKGPSEASNFFERLATVTQRPTDLTKLERAGVMTYDKEKGELLSVSQMLAQVSSQWKEISKDKDRAASIADAFAGQRQLDNFLALINNYPKLLNYQQQSVASFGEGEKAVSAMMNNLELQVNRVMPSVGTAITKALLPTDEWYQTYTNFFKFVADSADQFSKRKQGGLDASYLALDPTGIVRNIGIGHLWMKALFGQGGALSGSETSAKEGEPGFIGPVQPSTVSKDVTLGMTKYSSPDTLGVRPITFTDAADRSKHTLAEINQIARTAEMLAQAQLSAMERYGMSTKEAKQEWSEMVKIIYTADGAMKVLTGEAAAFYSVAEKAKQAISRPQLQTMPELNPERAQRLQGYLTQYSGLLKGLGVEQTPQDYMMFGQGGALYKYQTSSEAMQLAMAMLQEEIRKNTDQLDKNDRSLRGSYNIPTAFGYKPPTPWDYYASGATDMGPVNYPWMFDKEGGSGYTKGDKFIPTLGKVPSGITQSFSTPGLDVGAQSIGAHTAAVNADTAALRAHTASPQLPKMIAGGRVGPDKTGYFDDYWQRHPELNKNGEWSDLTLGMMKFPDVQGGDNKIGAGGGGVPLQTAMLATQTNTAAMATRIPSGLDRVSSSLATSNYFLQSIAMQLSVMTGLLNRPVNVYVRGGGGGGGSSSVGGESGTPSETGQVGFAQGFAAASGVSAMRG